MIVCMCSSYLIKSMTQPPALQAVLKPRPYCPCSVLYSWTNVMWMWWPALLCSITVFAGFVFTLQNSSSNMLRTVGLVLLCPTSYITMTHRLPLASYAPLCQSEPWHKVQDNKDQGLIFCSQKATFRLKYHENVVPNNLVSFCLLICANFQQKEFLILLRHVVGDFKN